jgi:hypothetical protein
MKYTYPSMVDFELFYHSFKEFAYLLGIIWCRNYIIIRVMVHGVPSSHPLERV